jgi:hypothetical protein
MSLQRSLQNGRHRASGLQVTGLPQFGQATVGRLLLDAGIGRIRSTE